MKNKVLISITALIISISISAGGFNMIVKLRNGENFVYNTDEIDEVFFEKNEFEEEGILDVLDSPLKFEITSDSTVKVIRDGSYKSFTEVMIRYIV